MFTCIKNARLILQPVTCSLCREPVLHACGSGEVFKTNERSLM